MRTSRKNKYLNQILEISKAPIQVSALKYNKEVGDYRPGLRTDFLGGKEYNVVNNIDFDDRTVTPFEVVFDIDNNSYKNVLVIAKAINEVCNRWGAPIYWFATGGKGLHGHIFFDLKLNDVQTKILKEATKYGYCAKNIRLWLFNEIKNSSLLTEKILDSIDDKPMKFNYLEGTSHLIRACGGRKAETDNFSGITEFYYKTYIPPEEFELHLKKRNKLKIKDKEGVRYPENIQQYYINPEEDGFIDHLRDYISRMEKTSFKERNIKLDCKYLEISGVKEILKGLSEGNRSVGARIIATACRKDELTKAEAEIVLQEYVNNCDGTMPFTLFEAKNWIDWVYRLPLVYWNCIFLEELGVHDKNTCQFCLTKHKKYLDILKDKNLLDKIQKVLNSYIVGEDSTKMLIFLLLLSSKFPSPTGKPGWNVVGDPQSQNIILASDSSSGKSYVAKGVLQLFGKEDEDYYVVSRISSSSFNYMEQNMDNKIMFIEEMQGLNDENTNQLRVWMSEGKLKFNTVEKVKTEEGLEVNKIVTKSTIGNPCFITCQAEGEIGEQLLNRSWVIGMDVSSKQTADILDYQCEIDCGNIEKKVELNDIVQALKLLEPRHFLIDFLHWRKLNIPSEDIRTRRDFPKFITLVKCVAFLYQYQRETITNENGVEYIKCTYEDYDIALRYAQDILGATFSGLTLDQISLLNTLKIDHSPDDDLNKYFTVNDVIRRYPNKSHTHWRQQLKHLCNMGFILLEEASGINYTYMLNKDKAFKVINLPTSKELKLLNEGKTVDIKQTATKENILKFMQHYPEHLIPWIKIKNTFSDSESILQTLRHSGDIMEAKPGMFILL